MFHLVQDDLEFVTNTQCPGIESGSIIVHYIFSELLGCLPRQQPLYILLAPIQTNKSTEFFLNSHSLHLRYVRPYVAWLRLDYLLLRHYHV